MGEPTFEPSPARVRTNQPTSFVPPRDTEVAGGLEPFEVPYEPGTLPHLPAVPDLRSE
jgi:hypothetical protein